MRSLSQSSGMDRFAKENEDSDSESVSSVNESSDLQFRVYAEVLYPFEPAGLQELRLEKGALIEVIRREPGPWWWGQIKLDAILSKEIGGDDDHRNQKHDDEDDEEHASLEGWFPKEFVRVIPPFPPPKSIASSTQQQDDMNNKMNKLVETKICDMRIAQNNSHNSFSRNNSTGSNVISPACLFESNDILRTSTATSTTSSQSSRQTRENIVRELLATEINYVKLLASLCLG